MRRGLWICAALLGCTPLQELGAQCDLNSQCDAPLVCRYEYCRVACAEDRDCPPGSHCVADNQGLGSCLLPRETECPDDSACPMGLVCDGEGLCRVPCMSSDVCLWSGSCVGGFCRDTMGRAPLLDGGLPECAEETCNGRDDDCDGATDEGADAWCDGRDHATGECRDGRCAFACDPGFGDCDDVDASGCETDLTSDAAHCGACGAACDAPDGASSACVASSCAEPVCVPGRGDCNRDVDADGCESDLMNDDFNCGACNLACSLSAGGAETCSEGACELACDLGFGDCDLDPSNGCEVATSRDESHCGICGRACSAGQVCAAGRCVPHAFPSDGSDGALEVTADQVLPPGVHHYTTIHVHPGATLTTTGSGVLELYASGDVLVEGTIDLSGSVGGIGANYGSSSGGATGTPLSPGLRGLGMCQPAATGGTGIAGESAPTADSGCAVGGSFGGGNSGQGRVSGNTGGGGGGGYAGGGGGGGINAPGGAGASHGADVGGAAGDTCVFGGGGAATPYFAGTDGSANTSCRGAGGGGGSIGATAAADLAIASTFRPGSGGGGGGCGYVGIDAVCGGGGGGGGGALRLASQTRIEIAATGALRADGGAGGATSHGDGGAGGGGSGGAIVLAAPELEMRGSVSVVGGRGGDSPVLATRGGAGGPGRIRVSVDPDACRDFGTWAPATFSCAVNEAPTEGAVYVGRYPD